MAGGADLPAGGLGSTRLVFVMEMTQVPTPAPCSWRQGPPSCTCQPLPPPVSFTVGGGREEGLSCSRGA